MAQQCTICTHKQRKQIEAAIAANKSNSAIACSFSVGRMAVARHKKNCIAPLVQEVLQERRSETKQTLATALDRVQRDMSLIDEAMEKVWNEKGKDLEMLLRVLTQSRQQNKLYALLTGELKKQSDPTDSPEWQEAWAIIFSALDIQSQQKVIVRLEEERAKRRSA